VQVIAEELHCQGRLDELFHVPHQRCVLLEAIRVNALGLPNTNRGRFPSVQTPKDNQ